LLKSKVLVIIPAFNEEESIGRVIKDIPESIVEEVVVVNNCSTDDTEKIAIDCGATVLNEDRKGYGYACLKGIEYAKSKPSGSIPDVIVFLDGDYSDYPNEIESLVSPIIEHGYDMVIGSRTLGNREKGAMLPQAIIGNVVATILIQLFFGTKFTDLGPFRAIKFEKLLDLDIQDKTFGWTVEMQVKAAKRSYRCCEVPVSYRRRIGVSKITGTLMGTIKASYMIFWTILKNI